MYSLDILNQILVVAGGEVAVRALKVLYFIMLSLDMLGQVIYAASGEGAAATLKVPGGKVVRHQAAAILVIFQLLRPVIPPLDESLHAGGEVVRHQAAAILVIFQLADIYLLSCNFKLLDGRVAAWRGRGRS